MSQTSEVFDPEKAAALVGKYILIGLAYLDAHGAPLSSGNYTAGYSAPTSDAGSSSGFTGFTRARHMSFLRTRVPSKKPDPASTV